MKLSYFYQNLVYSLMATVAIISMIEVVGAQVRTSNNYQLQSDSINVGGGFSSSTNYQQENTVGEIGTGISNSSTYYLRAGYQQMQEVFISLATTGDVIMSPNLPGLTGGTSNGSSTFTVTTDSPSGYQLQIEAESSPALRSGSNSIADYDALGTPDFTFAVGGGTAAFGFTPQGLDIVQAYKDNGSNCNIGTQDTSLACWDGLTVAPKTIAEGIGSNHPAGATTTVNFRVGLGSNSGVVSGVYTATTTVTALPL